MSQMATDSVELTDEIYSLIDRLITVIENDKPINPNEYESSRWVLTMGESLKATMDTYEDKIEDLAVHAEKSDSFKTDLPPFRQRNHPIDMILRDIERMEL